MHVILLCMIYVLYGISCEDMFGSYKLNYSQFNEENDCPEFPSVQNANIKIESFGRNNKVARIYCFDNYDLVGNSDIYCVFGQWEYLEAPRCQKTCSPPPFLENAKIVLGKKAKDIVSPTGKYRKGTVVTYTCISGYTLIPAASHMRVCNEGNWTGSDGFCKPDTLRGCPPPKAIENGQITPNFFLQGANVGEYVFYQCNSGYSLVGHKTVQCNRDGAWEPDPPMCQNNFGNPFADFTTPAPAPAAPAANGIPDFFTGPAGSAESQNAWNANGFSASNVFQSSLPNQVPQQQPPQSFNDLTSFFNANEPSVFDQIAPSDQSKPQLPIQTNIVAPQRPPQPAKLLTGDLESSLTSLVENLTMDVGGTKWNSPKNQPKPASASGWQPQPMAATTATSYKPMMGVQQSQVIGQSVIQPIGTVMQYPMGSVQTQQPQTMGSPKIGAQVSQAQPADMAFDPFGNL